MVKSWSNHRLWAIDSWWQEQGLEALSNCDPEAEHRLLYQAPPGDPQGYQAAIVDEFIIEVVPFGKPTKSYGKWP